MRDYETAYAGFSASALAAEILTGDFDAGLNACFECCDRWADSDRVALSWMGEAEGRGEEVNYRSLRGDSARFANVLHQRGIRAGDVVAGMLPRIPSLFVAVLATWRVGAVYQPLFTAFGPAAIDSIAPRDNTRLEVAGTCKEVSAIDRNVPHPTPTNAAMKACRSPARGQFSAPNMLRRTSGGKTLT